MTKALFAMILVAVTACSHDDSEGNGSFDPYARSAQGFGLTGGEPGNATILPVATLNAHAATETSPGTFTLVMPGPYLQSGKGPALRARYLLRVIEKDWNGVQTTGVVHDCTNHFLCVSTDSNRISIEVKPGKTYTWWYQINSFAAVNAGEFKSSLVEVVQAPASAPVVAPAPAPAPAPASTQTSGGVSKDSGALDATKSTDLKVASPTTVRLVIGGQVVVGTQLVTCNAN